MLEDMRELRLQREYEEYRDAIPFRMNVPEKQLQDLTDRLSVPRRVSPKKKQLTSSRSNSGIRSTFSSAHRQLLPVHDPAFVSSSPGKRSHLEQTRPMSLKAATDALIQWIDDATIILNQCVFLMTKVKALPDKVERVGIITEADGEKFAFDQSQIWFGRCEPLPHRVKAAIECLSSTTSDPSVYNVNTYSRLEVDTVQQLQQRLRSYMLQFQQIHHAMQLSIQQRGGNSGLSFRTALDAITDATIEEQSRQHNWDISVDRTYSLTAPSAVSEMSIGSDDMDSFLLRHSSDDAPYSGWKQGRP